MELEAAPAHLQGWLRAALDDERLRRVALAALHVFAVGGRDVADLEDSVERIKAAAARPGGLWESGSPFCSSNSASMISAVSFRLDTLEAATAALRSPDKPPRLGAPAAVQSLFSVAGAREGDKPKKPALSPGERKAERAIKAVLGAGGPEPTPAAVPVSSSLSSWPAPKRKRFGEDGPFGGAESTPASDPFGGAESTPASDPFGTAESAPLAGADQAKLAAIESVHKQLGDEADFRDSLTRMRASKGAWCAAYKEVADLSHARAFHALMQAAVSPAGAVSPWEASPQQVDLLTNRYRAMAAAQ